jgi:hypothetical protein
MDLSDPKHPNHNLPYVQSYLRDIGVRKCEANVIVTTPEDARDLCRSAIEAYVGDAAIGRFEAKTAKVEADYADMIKKYGIENMIQDIIDHIDNYDEDSE